MTKHLWNYNQCMQGCINPLYTAVNILGKSVPDNRQNHNNYALQKAPLTTQLFTNIVDIQMIQFFCWSLCI